MQDEIPLMLAALRLGRPYRSTQKLMLRNQLGPARQVAGRWLVSAAGVDAFLERAKSDAEPPPGASSAQTP
jgi:hypothetical protein